ncbi:MAG TPA: hypothetical protein VFA30_02640 [Gaiellaceae bacterium]|nr:hypothetical protein [Gaiellaceae bacterium]
MKLRKTVLLAATACTAIALTVIGGASAAGPGRSVAAAGSSTLVNELALGRLATAKYANNLALAKASGYGIITKMIPNMGYHFMNPNVKGFNITKPAILVYEHRGSTWQLGALEWVFTSKPAKPPLPGAKYGSFGAGCHYKDGTYVPAAAQAQCPMTAPGSGAAFNFWHPLLITMHVWLWYPNPAGLFSGTNPLAAAFNKG